MDRRKCLTTLIGVAGCVAVPPVRSSFGSALAFSPQGRGEQKAPPMIPGPDPNTKTPAYKAPPGAVDTHTHIFGPPGRYPYAPVRSYTAPDAPLEMFRALHEKIGIDRAVIVNATLHGTDNRVVTDAIAAGNGRYKGIANVDYGISDRELEDLARAGIKGCRFIFISRLGARPDLSKISRIAERIKPLGWHIDLYLEAQHLDDFRPTLTTLATNYVIDHMGAIQVGTGVSEPAFKSLVGLAQRDEKCWIKITGPERMSKCGAPFYDAVPIAQQLIAAAPDRVIWGSDWPHPNVPIMPNDGDLVDLIPLYVPHPIMQRKLLIDNPTRLFGFGPWPAPTQRG